MKAKSKNPVYKNDYQMNIETAEKIIEIIESGDVQKWRKTWTTSAGKGISAIYQLVIDGMLAVNAYNPSRNYDPLKVPPGFYVNFHQIKDHKLHLKKGSQGIPNYKPCCFYKYLTQTEKIALLAEIKTNKKLNEEINALCAGKISSLFVNLQYKDDKGNERIFQETIERDDENKIFKYKKFQWVLEYLFRAEDCNLNIKELWNIGDGKPAEVNDLIRIQRVEDVKNSYIERSRIKYSEVSQNKAYYVPANHSVVIPTKNQFETIEDYYQTVLHEFAHSTGHPSLLNRKTLTASCGFASVMYSKEELVAELSSLYTMISLDLMNDRLLENSIAYLKGWGNSLKDGIRYNILNTIAQSRKATNLILGIDENEKALTLSVAD